MNYYTLDKIMGLNPCHTRDKLETYMKGRKRISLSGILSSKASDDDKVWLVTRLLPVDAAAKFAKWCADSVSHIDNNRAAADAALWAATRAAADAATRAASYVDTAAWDAAYNKARRNQVNQLKLIVKENKL